MMATEYRLSDLRAAKHADIETHSERGYGDRHMAINVKYRGAYPDADDATVTAAWDRTCEDFWERAREIAQDHGYTDVFSEGRSGGWLVPYFQSRPARSRYMGQGGSLGYPRYPDDENLADRAQFLAFRADILELLADTPAMLADTVRDMIETVGEYPD